MQDHECITPVPLLPSKRPNTSRVMRVGCCVTSPPPNPRPVPHHVRQIRLHDSLVSAYPITPRTPTQRQNTSDRTALSPKRGRFPYSTTDAERTPRFRSAAYYSSYEQHVTTKRAFDFLRRAPLVASEWRRQPSWLKCQLLSEYKYYTHARAPVGNKVIPVPTVSGARRNTNEHSHTSSLRVLQNTCKSGHTATGF